MSSKSKKRTKKHLCYNHTFLFRASLILQVVNNKKNLNCSNQPSFDLWVCYADDEVAAAPLTRWQESLGRPHWPQSKPRTTQMCRKLCQTGAKPHSYVFGKKKVDTLGCGIWQALLTLVEDGVNAGQAMPEAARADNWNEGDMESIFQDTRQIYFNRHKRDIGRFGILRWPLLCCWDFAQNLEYQEDGSRVWIIMKRLICDDVHHSRQCFNSILLLKKQRRDMGGALEVGNMGGLHKFQSGAGFGYNQLAPGWSHNCTVPGLNPGLLCKVKSRIH